MRWIDVFRISFRMLQTNMLRSILTTLGIGVAISLIVVLIGLGTGLQEIAIGSIVESKSLLSLDVTALPEKGIPVTLTTVDEVKKITGVQEVTPVITTSGEVRIKEKLGAVTVIGAEKSYLEMEGVALNKGRAFENDKKEIVVSPQILELLDLSKEDILETPAKLNYNDPSNENQSKTTDEVIIVGVTDGTDSPTVYVPFALLATSESPKITSVKAVAEDRESLVVARDVVSTKGYQVETLLETLDQARTVFKWVTLGLTIFGLIALVVAAIGMFNTLTIALLERTREIGIMKAIGITDGTVKRLFLAESGILGVAGGLSGIVIGLSVDNVLGLLLNSVAENFGGTKVVLFQYPPFFLLGMVLFPVVLALLTGLYPAIRASHLNPLRALKYE